MMKRLAITLLCLASIFNLLAQDRFYIEDFSICPGETKQVSMMLDNAIEYTALQADILLPEGLSVAMEDDEYVFDLTERKSRTHTISSNLLSSGAIRILIASQKKSVFSGNSGALVTFQLVADANLAEPKVITISNVIASETNSTTHNLSLTTCTLTVVKPVMSVSLNQLNAEMTEGETLQLTATVLPNDATDKTVTWSTSDATVATVDNNGLVTALAPGTATITATTNDGTNLTANCEVIVNPAVIFAASLTLNQTEIVMADCESLQLTATVLPEDATDKTVTWNTSNEAAATVNNNGLVTAVAAGTATISAITNDGTNLTANCLVTVIPAPDAIELNEQAFRLQLTKTKQLNVVTEGVHQVTWNSSEPAIASVDANGLVTAHKNGIAIITATMTNGVSTWCSVYSYLRGDIDENNTVDVSDINKDVNIVLGKE